MRETATDKVREATSKKLIMQEPGSKERPGKQTVTFEESAPPETSGGYAEEVKPS